MRIIIKTIDTPIDLPTDIKVPTDIKEIFYYFAEPSSRSMFGIQDNCWLYLQYSFFIVIHDKQGDIWKVLFIKTLNNTESVSLWTVVKEEYSQTATTVQ